ncbi:multidrug effflux MFS transporter [Bauldia sp.]|uniref:multidrug effflux MFS transporter n=1 Tax=Bauldia sp. TaxID=2575872 RepID=UPI003BAC7571
MNPGFTRFALVLGLLSAIGPIAIDMYMPGLPVIAADFGTDVGAAQMTLVTFFLALAVGQPVYGPLADAYGRRLPLIGGLILFVAAGVGCIYAPTMDALIALRFVQGFGICSAAVIVRAVIRDLYTGPEAARLLALTFLVLGVSPLLAPMAGTFLIAALSWRSVFWVFALTGALGLVVVLWQLPETLPPEKRDRRSLARAFSGYGAFFFDGRFMALTMITGLIQTVLFSFVVGSAFFFMGVHGLPAWLYSILFATCAVVGIGLAQFSAPAMRRLGAERLVYVAVSVTAAGSTLFLLMTLTGIDPIYLTLPLIWITFAGLAFVMAPGTVLALDPYGDKAGTASALMGTLQFGMSAVGAGIVSALFDGTALPLAATMSVCAMLALIITSRTLSLRPAIA